MTPEERIRRQIGRLRPHAKFVAVAHSSSFIDPAAALGDGFYTANLYDERIDANMITSRVGPVMVQNTYIASFAYNLFLCVLRDHKHRGAQSRDSRDSLETLLHLNLKKFFAEQVYRAHNCIASRALLLETLLFEQAAMVPVFADKGTDPALAADADAGASLMSFALSMHELGHFYLGTRPALWAEIEAAEPETIAPLYRRVAASHPPDVAVEFQCDVHAVIGCLGQYDNHAGPAFALRALVFAFAAYAAMYSAAATAEATARSWRAQPSETVDFHSIAAMPHVDHSTHWAIDRPFLDRARLVAELCEALAERRGVALYGEDGPFPLARTVVADLMAQVGRVFDCADDNARKMSNLVAQSLHGHDEGMEYLYLRSKVFTTRREEPLVV